MTTTRIAIVALALCLGAARSNAQEPGKHATGPGVKGFRGDFLTQLDATEKKLVDLANAIPDEKYSWRPEEGVRSVSEVYVHVAGANYFFLSFAGVKPPDGISQDMEKTVTRKADVVEALKKSFAFAREAVMKMTDADLAHPAKMFGQETTVEGVLFVMSLHMHEHLGQSIAYARMNGVVPPWTAAQMKQSSGKKGSD